MNSKLTEQQKELNKTEALNKILELIKEKIREDAENANNKNVYI